MTEPRITKAVDGTSAYFTVYWSRLRKAEKYDIIQKVPSVSGIFELYYKDEQKKLNLLYVAKAYYGGLMNELRKRTDPELEDNEKRRKILSDRDCYYRYSPSDSYKDMTDDKAKALLDEFVTIDSLGQKLREMYLPEFRKVLPEKKVGEESFQHSALRAYTPRTTHFNRSHF